MNKIKIDTRHDLKTILTRLSAVPRKENGQISWRSDLLDTGTFDLIFCLTFKPEVDDHVKDGAIWQTLNDCARADNFSPKFFIHRLQEFLTEYESKTTQSISGICQLNCTLSAKLPKSIRSFSGTVYFSTSLKASEQAALNKSEPYDREKLGLHSDFMYASILVKSPDHRSAIDLAERNLKFAFGLLNLCHHGYGISKRFGYPNTPMGKFLTSSVIFIVERKHYRLGNYYSDNNYPSNYKSNFSVWSKIDEEGTALARHYINDLKKIDYPEKLIQAVILFQEGLEATSVDGALLKLWTGIELLCSRDDREKSDYVVKRASSIFRNPEHAAIRLQFAQEFRNKIVHRGSSSDHALLCAQWESIFLAEIIRFCLFNKHKLYRHDQILNYMSTPINRDKIKESIDIYKKRLKSIATE